MKRLHGVISHSVLSKHDTLTRGCFVVNKSASGQCFSLDGTGVIRFRLRRRRSSLPTCTDPK